MSTSTTPPLTVAGIIPPPLGGSKLTFTLSTPYQATLYLASIVITRATTGSSKILPGTDPTHGGRVLMYVDASTFTGLCSLAMPFNVVVAYDSATNKVIELQIGGSVFPALPQAIPNALGQGAE